MPSRRAELGLDALNLFLADVRDGLGPYLAIYLIAARGPDQGWNEATVGLVMTMAGLAGLLAQTPAGAFIDASRNKPRIVIAAALAVTLSCLALPFTSNFYVVAATQSLAAVAGAIFPPALAAITLGIVGPAAFTKRIGRNEAFNHLGNAAAAAIAAGTAILFGPIVVFWLMAILALLSIGAMLAVPKEEIDDTRARGLADDGADDGGKGESSAPSSLGLLLSNRTLLLFAVLCFLFHLSNAAMLPSTGQLLTRVVGSEQATSLIARCIVAAQCVMVPVALAVGAKADAWGHKPIFLVAFGVLALRGALYPVSDDPYWLFAVQTLDGVGAGIYGALFPVVVADLTYGTGHFNISQGAIATAQGLGAALSASLTGGMIVWAGYPAAFLSLSAIAAAGFLIYALAMPETGRSTARGPAQ
ncbi:MFS transporter [Xanthobacter sp. KR7-65]|uniref:MFS transporter n=1 Tax=Xanthobacter sp. KR7-65 TaxID=3156612 RepID=UPI0032B56065